MSSSGSREFSVHPILHYILAICCPLLLLDIYWSAHVYYCWHTTAGADSTFCSGDRIQNEETAGHHALFSHVAVIYNLLLIPVLAIIYAPFFVVALHINRPWRISQNIVGRVYWIVALAVGGFHSSRNCRSGEIFTECRSIRFASQPVTSKAGTRAAVYCSLPWSARRYQRYILLHSGLPTAHPSFHGMTSAVGPSSPASS